MILVSFLSVPATVSCLGDRGVQSRIGFSDMLNSYKKSQTQNVLHVTAKDQNLMLSTGWNVCKN